MKTRLLLFFLIICLSLFAQQPWQSELLKIDSKGNLTYYPDEDGFIIPDFSHAGYRGGDAELPDLPVKKEISPIAGDNAAHIQAAIDAVAAMPADENGHKGAVLLTAGKYNVAGTINLNSSGVVLRGVGDGADEKSNTILYATGNSPSSRNVIMMGKSSTNATNYWWWSRDASSSVSITTDIIHVGDYSFEVTNASNYKIGDQIIVYHPISQEWLDAIDGGGASEPWLLTMPSGLPNHIMFNRVICAINGNKITVDAPFFYTLNKSLTQCSIHKYSRTDFVSEVGVENVRIDIQNAGGTDLNHAACGIHTKCVDNGWIRHCSVLHYSTSCFRTEGTNRFTVDNCQALDPVAPVSGNYMYGFNTYCASQLILFKECYARGGRHNYVSDGISTTSGCVFWRCKSELAQETSEGHRHWTSGMLFDCFKDYNTSRYVIIGLSNRGDWGSAGEYHGWSAVQSFLWNSEFDTQVSAILLQKPPTSQNYAIGCSAKEVITQWCWKNETLGYLEGFNKKGIEPASLYEAQWNARHRQELTSVSDNKKDANYSIIYLQKEKILKVKGAGKRATVKVVGALGNIVLSKDFSDETELSLQYFPLGMYIVRVVEGIDTFVSEKIIIER